MSKDSPVGVPSPYLIHCVKDEDFGSCGQSTYLTGAEYEKQLMSSHGWRCPRCRCYPCYWDDANYETALNKMADAKV